MENCKQFATGIYEKLFNVITKINNPRLKSVDALLIDLTGDHTAGLMLGKLFYWWSKSKDGWVYKSWRDWDAELRLTRNQVGRVHSRGYLEAIGVERVQKQTSKGNPVHYRLNVGKFLKALAKFIGIGIQQVLGWINGKEATKETPTKEESACVETKQATNNNISQKNIQTKDVVVNLPFFVPDKKIRELLLKYGLNRILEMAAYAVKRASHNPAGFFMRGLEENWDISPQKPAFQTAYGYGASAKTTDNPFVGMKWSDFAEN